MSKPSTSTCRRPLTAVPVEFTDVADVLFTSAQVTNTVLLTETVSMMVSPAGFVEVNTSRVTLTDQLSEVWMVLAVLILDETRDTFDAERDVVVRPVVSGNCEMARLPAARIFISDPHPSR